MKKFSLSMLPMMFSIMMNAMEAKQTDINIIANVVSDTTSEVWISHKRFAKGDTIALWSGHIICPADSAQCVFVDYYPFHNWGHDCAYFL